MLEPACTPEREITELQGWKKPPHATSQCLNKKKAEHPKTLADLPRDTKVEFARQDLNQLLYRASLTYLVSKKSQSHSPPLSKKGKIGEAISPPAILFLLFLQDNSPGVVYERRPPTSPIFTPPPASLSLPQPPPVSRRSTVPAPCQARRLGGGTLTWLVGHADPARHELRGTKVDGASAPQALVAKVDEGKKGGREGDCLASPRPGSRRLRPGDLGSRHGLPAPRLAAAREKKGVDLQRLPSEDSNRFCHLPRLSQAAARGAMGSPAAPALRGSALRDCSGFAQLLAGKARSLGFFKLSFPLTWGLRKQAPRILEPCQSLEQCHLRVTRHYRWPVLLDTGENQSVSRQSFVKR
ncbi:uncharacterized protein LOC110211264 [Phascolarctos cinereus]